MKLTKEKLKQIIREELQEIHSPQQAWSSGEEPPPMPSTGEEPPGKPRGKSYQIEGPEGDIVVHGKSHKLIDNVLGRVNLSKVIREWINMECRK